MGIDIQRKKGGIMVMPKKGNNDVSQTVAAIDVILTLKDQQETKDNEILFNILADNEQLLKDQLVRLCRPSKPSKKE